MTPAFEVLEPGLLTTIQDGGRFGFGHLGVPRSGACDPWSLAVANLLVGNEPDHAALELTVAGPTLRALRSCVVGLAGTDLGATVHGGRGLATGRSHALAAGEVVAFPGTANAVGARAYVALPGGVDVPDVLGSRSTCLAARFGGLDGRPLRAGDRLASDRDPGDAPDGLVWIHDHDPEPIAEAPIRVLPGPDAGLLDRLAAIHWTVATASDRMGLRLEGPAVPMPGEPGDRRPHGVVPGTIQLPPDGLPIVLLADAQPTGGYPVPAVTISADLHRLGQLRPGMRLRLLAVDVRTAEAARREQAAAFRQGRARLAELAGWDDLWRSARG
jgi:biotin-dependent carboxylase-like uncharacterized protein